MRIAMNYVHKAKSTSRKINDRSICIFYSIKNRKGKDRIILGWAIKRV